MSITYFCKICCCLLVSFSAFFTSEAQSFSDTLDVKAGAYMTVAQNSFQPFWIIANRHHTISDRKADVTTYLYLKNVRHFDKGLYYQYGFNLFYNNQFSNLLLEQGYIFLGYKKWALQAGRFEEITGDLSDKLSSGALGISGNAVPVPRIGLRTNAYVSVPFTDDWLQFNFSWYHGWLGKQRVIKEARLHQKILYLKVGKDHWSLYGGFNHFVLWGGIAQSGDPLPGAFQDYLRVIVGASAKDSIAANINGELVNALGDHRGVFDFGLNFNMKNNHRLHVYTQTLFEKGVGTGAHSRDRIAGFKVFSPDRLAGVRWERPGTFLQNLLIEYIHTQYQGGREFFIGRDHYYNNGLYQTGWWYQGKIIGTPLFVDQTRAKKYFGEEKKIGDWNIVNNRITGIHLGVAGNIFEERLQYKMLFTLTENYGNYYNDALFTPRIKQFYSLVAVETKLSPTLSLTAQMAVDAGGFSDNIGGLLGIHWQYTKTKRLKK